MQRHAEAVSLLHDVEILHAIGDDDQMVSYIFDDQIVNDIRTLIVYYKNGSNSIVNFLRRMRAYKNGFVRMQKPDLVHANIMQLSMLFAVYLKKRFGIPFVITEHWSGFLKMNRSTLSGLQFYFAKFISKNASYVLPVSNFLLNDLKEMGFQSRMEIVQNVVDTDLFKVKTGENEKFIFLHISNLVNIKNPDKMITAAAKLGMEFNNFEFHIGGDGNVGILNHQIEELNAKHLIKTFGILKLEEVAEKMRKSNCFVLFSTYENLPCVLLESLSSGTPVIATKVGGIPEMINEKKGILISNSAEELYQEMKNMLQQKHTFDSPHDLHQYIVARFSKRVIANKFDLIYRQVLA